MNLSESQYLKKMRDFGTGSVDCLVIQRLLGGDAPPNKVQEVKNESYANLQVLQRNESMRLFAPNPNAPDKKPVYEIVLERPHSETINTSYSLYRAPTQAAAEEKFEAFHQRLPELVKIVREMYNINGLQKICDILIENPSWSLAHIIAHFNLTEYIPNPSVVDFLDYAEYSEMMTPLQVAVKGNNLEFVKSLVSMCNLEHLDKNSNSVFHYAASTTKEMINLLTAKSTLNLNHCNADGYTPLHLSCLADKPDCVKALLLAGADTNKRARCAGNSHSKSIPSSNVADFMASNPNKLFTQDMKHGGTPLHWSSSREVLNSLIERGCDANLINFNGQTPLHVMVARDRLECVVALLAHEAEIDVVDNSGNTPLHIAVEKKLIPIVQCLVVFGADINKPNKDGKTPRHMVGRDDNGSKDAMILYILHSVGAKRCPADKATKCPPGCSTGGAYNGVPPAEPETSEQREHIQQVVNIHASTITKPHRNSVPSLVSNAIRQAIHEERPVPEPVKTIDVSQERKGASMMDAILSMFMSKVDSVSKPTSPTSTSSSFKGGNLLGDFDVGDEPMLTDEVGETTVGASKASSAETGKPQQRSRTPCEAGSSSGNENSPSCVGRGRLLCLDGGGIRGLVLAQMLLEIEQLSQTPISHLFDWIAGTSTGGILALAVGCGKTMKQCMCLYLRMKDQAFVGSRPYPSDQLESVLKEQLGEFTVMTDIKHPRLMVTGVMADRKPVNLHLFRNYECASDIMGIVTPSNNRCTPPPPPCDQLVWRAARATGAAPSYFRAFGRFLDGGLIANNPTLDAMTEIHELNAALHYTGRSAEAVPVSVVVSLGTGLTPVVDLKEIDVYRPGGIWDTAKVAYGISTISTLLVDQATASDGRVVDRARAWCSMIGVPYFRFNPQMSVDIAMDEKIDEPLINMLWEAKAYMHSNRKQVIELINLLK